MLEPLCFKDFRQLGVEKVLIHFNQIHEVMDYWDGNDGFCLFDGLGIVMMYWSGGS